MCMCVAWWSSASLKLAKTNTGQNVEDQQTVLTRFLHLG
jgi:hypothetical protein